MKFDCGETWAEKKARLSAWHRWFAWHPIRISDHDYRWLELVARKGEYHGGYAHAGWSWEYRAIGEVK